MCAPPPLKAGNRSTSAVRGPMTLAGRAGRAWNSGRVGVGIIPSSACASAWISVIFLACKCQKQIMKASQQFR